MNKPDDNAPTGKIFSYYTERILLDAGWSEERVVNIDHFIIELAKYGYSVFPLVAAFLRNFGGLIVDYYINTKYGSLRLYTHFNPIKAMKYPDELETCINKINHPICIIGETGNQDITLLMDVEGTVYGCCEGKLFFYGNSAKQAIEKIISEDRHRIANE